MSLPFIMRVVVAMTLLPDADYPEVIRVLTGLLPRLPWARRWQVPTHKTITAWRRRLGTWPLEQLFWRVAGPLAEDGAPGSVMVAGRPLCSMDGFELDVPATAVFSCTGVSKDSRWKGRGTKGQVGKGQDVKVVQEGSFPHLRCLLVTACAGRAVLGAAADATDTGEQSLVARLVRDHPELFAGRVFLMDRNFLGYHLITAILDAGGHLIMRVKSGISLQVTEGGWLPDGSRLTYLDEPARHKAADRLPLRVAEHNVVLPGAGGEVSETCTIATTLLDHRDADAGTLRAAYPMRWAASETTIGENKTTVTGPARRPPRACAPASPASSTRNSGPGWPPPSWCAPAPPPRPPPRPPAPSAPAATRQSRPAPIRSPSPPCAAPPRRRCASHWSPRPPAWPPSPPWPRLPARPRCTP